MRKSIRNFIGTLVFTSAAAMPVHGTHSDCKIEAAKISYALSWKEIEDGIRFHKDLIDKNHFSNDQMNCLVDEFKKLRREYLITYEDIGTHWAYRISPIITK